MQIQGVQAHAASAASTTTASAAGGQITANDFMTMLVTEMKNQDPTSPTDPSAYMQQLVEVNSLQQLISINQGISSLTGSSASTSTNGN